VSQLVEPLKHGKEIKAYKDVQEILDEISSKEDTELLERINFYTRVEENLTEIAGNIDPIHISYNNYYEAYLN
jgi:hypothetical protein